MTRVSTATVLPVVSVKRLLAKTAFIAGGMGAAWGTLLGVMPAAIATPKPNQFFEQAMTKTAVEIGEDPSGRYVETATFPVASRTTLTEITEPDGTTVILPPGYEAGRSYPALVLMPYTDRTALHMFNWGIYDAYAQRSENSFVVIMPPGRGSSANWSGYGWESFVNEYETYIQQDLDPIAAKYNVDINRMVLGGFSLGGDLSWALSLRNPELFSGAIVMGSMSTYRDEQNAQMLSDRNFRYFMVMGGYDGNRGSMHNALDTLDANAIDYHYEEVGSAGHGDLPEQMQSDLFLSAMDYILAERFVAY
ncbi:MAG: alpha/beta hydrolase-fold protein [Cyanobacteria bacterium J06632_3]